MACNVISSITGADLAILVTEPTISGFHDLKRVYDTAKKVHVSSGIIINKYGLSDKYSLLIEEFAQCENIPILGKIPLSQEVRRSTNREEIASLVQPNFPLEHFWTDLVEKIVKIVYID